ncbi:MAG: Fe-Mn family superoxide dismutase [Candidatus Taylorbacteria bacterium]|nr:Fe-Mn family superoxide dismutase [Candidatus Taylorbacteria bacterium]
MKMKTFTAKTFNIPALKGISAKNIEEHLKLYAGYVKNANLVIEKSQELMKDSEKNAYLLSELARRFSFEFNGMRNHEAYFASIEGGQKPLSDSSALKQAIESEFGSFDEWLASFKALAMTRGIGWAMLYYDPQDKRLLMSWIDEQHLGQLTECTKILALDMWEHSYVADYQPSGKKAYVEDFFANLNWEVAEENYKRAIS